MALPTQTYEIMILPDTTCLLRIYVPTNLVCGNNTLPEGRQLVALRSYPGINQCITDIKLLIVAPPITA